MAVVDFSNAVLQPYNANNKCPISYSDLSIQTDRYELRLVNSSGTRVTASDGDDIQVEKNEYNHFNLWFFGTFGTSGTEFYIKGGDGTIHWKVSGVSFANGDTYSFHINCSLTN